MSRMGAKSPVAAALALVCSILIAHVPAGVPNRSVSGVVTAVDAARLVIRRAGKTPPEMTFGVDASTVREGVVAVGATVQVRFRDGHPAVATAILVMRRS